MKLKLNSWFLLGIFICLFFNQALASAAEAPVAIAYHIERTKDFLVEPGNNPYEILRRLGREINKSCPIDSKEIYGASLLELEKLNSKEFLKPVVGDKLSLKQTEEAKRIIAELNGEFLELKAQEPDEGALTFKLALSTAELLKNIQSEKHRVAKKLTEQQLQQLNDNIIPYIEISDYLIGIVSISNSGIYLNGKLVSHSGKLPFKENGLTIGKYFNNSALITLAQNRGIQDIDELYKNLERLPQLGFFENALAVADIDFKKDILENLSTESLMSINLSPTGEGGLPDLRFVSPLAKIKEVKALLPKIKQLCMQNGFMNIYYEEPYEFVRTNFIMFPQFAIYSGFLNNLLIITTGKESFVEETNRLKVADAKDIRTMEGPGNKASTINKFDRYFRVDFKNFNQQLQQLLQSPLLQSKGIPPIPNLKFFDHMTVLEGHFELSAVQGLLKIKMPLKDLK